MKWFQGDIVAAITTAKSRGAIFVVYSEGKDENSTKLSGLIDSEAVTSLLESEQFVAIKIESDKEEYNQFVKIYQLVPVPSIFFIQNGIPLKVVTSAVKSADELVETITSLMQKSSPVQSQPQQQLRDEEKSSSSSTAAAAAESITITDPVSNTLIDEISANDTEDEKREKLEKARKLIEERRVAKIKEEQRLEREREIQRRKDGQEVLNLKKWQEDQEMKQLREERMREKAVEKAARQKILEQIEQDKRDRALKFASPGSTSTEKPPNSVTTPTSAPTSLADPKQARIQFKNPNGESEIVNFDSDMAFADLYAFVKSDLLKGSSQEFVLATAFPRREFSTADFNKNLIELGLTPSSVILIIFGKKPPASQPPSAGTAQPQSSNRGGGGGGIMDMFSTLFFGVVTPILAFFTFLRGFFARAITGGSDEAGKRKRDEEALTPNEAAKKRNLSAFQSLPEPSTSGGSSPTGAVPKSGSYKRPTSNIHRLHENSDSDEDRKTWNGNSTQQL